MHAVLSHPVKYSPSSQASGEMKMNLVFPSTVLGGGQGNAEQLELPVLLLTLSASGRAWCCCLPGRIRSSQLPTPSYKKKEGGMWWSQHGQAKPAAVSSGFFHMFSCPEQQHFIFAQSRLDPAASCSQICCRCCWVRAWPKRLSEDWVCWEGWAGQGRGGCSVG